MYVPFILICPVTWAPGRLWGKGDFLFSIRLLCEGSFSIFCPVPPPCHTIFSSSREEGTGARPFPHSPLLLKHCTFRECGATQWSRPIEPRCSSLHECVRLEWIELDFESPRPSPPTTITTSTATSSSSSSSSSPTLPFHSRWRHWQRGRERALIPKPVGSVHIQTRAFCLCCCEARVRLACREYKSDLWQEQLTCR